MNRNDRLTIDRETGDLFCEIERAQKLLSFVLVQQFPGKYGPEMMETMLEFVNDRLHFVLVRYNMIMGHNDRIGEEYYISMVRDMELAAKHEELQSRLLDVWSGNSYTKETQEKAMKARMDAGELSDVEAIATLEEVLKEIEKTPQKM